MSRHEGVSCDSCLKGNFPGRRYKCLICYDYDLCATCYESGNTTARHTTDHPMQCIITRTDFDLYYGGEALSSDQPQSFTCPYCSKMGFTEIVLLDHMSSEHAEAVAEVVCPICAALPSGDPNYVTDDFQAHLALEHRAPRELDEPMGGIRHVRRIPHPGRGAGGPRTRRSNMHFQSAGSALSGLAPSNRETMDPIAELLSQLSSVRSRAAAAQSVSSQLQQLEMQLQSTRYRQQLERLPRRQGESSRPVANGNQAPAAMLDFAAAVASGNNNNNNTPSTSSSSSTSQFLLAKYTDTDLTEMERQALEVERADRSAFVQELLLSSLAEGLRLDDDQSADSDVDGEVAVNQRREARNAGHEQQDSDGHRDPLLPRDGSPNTALHNGRSNDVIMHAPSQHASVTSGQVGSHGNIVKLNIDGASSERGKIVVTSSESSPSHNSH